MLWVKGHVCFILSRIGYNDLHLEKVILMNLSICIYLSNLNLNCYLG